jgi:hypothetical protein
MACNSKGDSPEYVMKITTARATSHCPLGHAFANNRGS